MDMRSILSIRKRISFFICPEVHERLENLELLRGMEKLSPGVITREMLQGGVKLALGDDGVKENYLSSLTEEEIKSFNQWGFDLAKSQWWKYLLDWAINTQAAKTLGVISHNRDQAIFGSGRIDGILLLRDEVDARKSAHEGDRKEPDSYDENRAILE